MAPKTYKVTIKAYKEVYVTCAEDEDQALDEAMFHISCGDLEEDEVKVQEVHLTDTEFSRIPLEDLIQL